MVSHNKRMELADLTSLILAPFSSAVIIAASSKDIRIVLSRKLREDQEEEEEEALPQEHDSDSSP